MIGYYWNPNVARADDYGHAVHCQANDMVASTDILRTGQVDYVPRTFIENRWGLRWLGAIDWTPSGAISLAPIPVPPMPVVKLAVVQAAAKIAARGPYQKLNDVKMVQYALMHAGLLKVTQVDGMFGPITLSAYAHWQRLLGHSGTESSGVPGKETLTILGAKYKGFTVA
jgi:hypothetical protein